MVVLIDFIYLNNIMTIDVELINGAHFEWKVVVYLLENIFPEFKIPNNEPWKWKNINTKKLLGISANLDNKLNGIRNDKDMTYYLDENVTKPYIFWTGEPFNVKVVSKTEKHKYIIISSLTHDGNSIQMPFASFWYIQYYLNGFLNKYRNLNNFSNKQYLLAYCASRQTKERSEFMNYFINKSKEINKIFCLGKCNNFECSKKLLPRDQAPNNIVVDEYSKFKFVLAMENCERKGYLTEKIICAFVSGSIPIYWGDHEYAKRLFNPKSFICIRDYESVEACIDYILNMSEEQIENMLKEPMFVDNIPPPEFDITNFEEGTFYGELKKKIRDICLNPI